MTGEITLKVIEARPTDVGRGIARVDPAVFRENGWQAGDVLSIAGKKKTAALIWPGYPDDTGTGVVRLDGNTRRNAGVSIDDGAVIHSFSNIVGARIGKGASIGPYARLRPGTVLGEGVRIGNFVETKAADLEAGVKVNHLTYIGDTHIGENANIGAGTITCNYDGFDKHRTEIGAGAFVGSNSSLVAPVKIGAGAYVGSGSVISKDVPDDALVVERSPVSLREGWAKRFREMKMLNRKPKSPK